MGCRQRGQANPSRSKTRQVRDVQAAVRPERRTIRLLGDGPRTLSLSGPDPEVSPPEPKPPLRAPDLPEEAEQDREGGLAVNPEALRLVPGASLPLRAVEDGSAPATWVTRDPTVATIDRRGQITALGPGRTVVTLRRDGRAVASVPVEVLDDTLVSLQIQPLPAQLTAGTSLDLVAIGTTTAGERLDVSAWVTWTTSRRERATIASGPRLLTRAPGPLTIRAAWGADNQGVIVHYGVGKGRRIREAAWGDVMAEAHLVVAP